MFSSTLMSSLFFLILGSRLSWVENLTLLFFQSERKCIHPIFRLIFPIWWLAPWNHLYWGLQEFQVVGLGGSLKNSRSSPPPLSAVAIKNNTTGEDLSRGQDVRQADSGLLLPQPTGPAPLFCRQLLALVAVGGAGWHVVVRCWVVLWSPCPCSHPSSATHQWLSLDVGHLLWASVSSPVKSGSQVYREDWNWWTAAGTWKALSKSDILLSTKLLSLLEKKIMKM